MRDVVFCSPQQYHVSKQNWSRKFIFVLITDIHHYLILLVFWISIHSHDIFCKGTTRYICLCSPCIPPNYTIPCVFHAARECFEAIFPAFLPPPPLAVSKIPCAFISKAIVAFSLCCFNVGPSSLTLAQHWNNIGWMLSITVLAFPFIIQKRKIIIKITFNSQDWQLFWFKL